MTKQPNILTTDIEVTIHMKSVEEDDREVYITGDFNHWDPENEAYRMTKNKSGYVLQFRVPTDTKEINFKFTRGGWPNGEIDEYGNITGNRKAVIGIDPIREIVQKWRTNWAPYKEKFFPVVELISNAFEIPQLNKKRRVWAILPNDYKNSKKSYPVLYLQDAQNLFHEGSAFGNWEIDKKMSILTEYGRGEVIIIAIEHGEEDRTKEYIVGKTKISPNSEGKKMIRFLADTLKPFIDKKYRTKPEREHTGIGGSSLGGLISIYAGFLYPEVYSKLMIFSPSLWISPKLELPMIKIQEAFESKMYIYAGDNESKNLISHVNTFIKRISHQVQRNGIDFEIKKSIRSGGKHSEFYWAQEFPRALEWLYYDSMEDPLVLGSGEIELGTA